MRINKDTMTVIKAATAAKITFRKMGTALGGWRMAATPLTAMSKVTCLSRMGGDHA